MGNSKRYPGRLSRPRPTCENSGAARKSDVLSHRACDRTLTWLRFLSKSNIQRRFGRLALQRRPLEIASRSFGRGQAWRSRWDRSDDSGNLEITQSESDDDRTLLFFHVRRPRHSRRTRQRHTGRRDRHARPGNRCGPISKRTPGRDLFPRRADVCPNAVPSRGGRALALDVV